MPEQPLGPIQIREELSTVLAAVEREPRLVLELERAKREYFAANPGVAADLHLEERAAAAELAALRFVEWYLCERPSEFLGATPIDVAQARLGVAHRVPTETVVGVFLVQRGGDEPSVRDLADNKVFDLNLCPESLEIGDALIGRLWASEDELGFVPSAAASIVSASPRFAVAFQQDVNKLGLDRRLTQAELEHLLFCDPAQSNLSVVDPDTPPLEHVEAELAQLLAAAGKTDPTPTEISDALRQSQRAPAVIEALLDEFAFETDVDLDATRTVLWKLAASVQARPTAGSEDADDGSSDTKFEPLIRERPKASRPRVVLPSSTPEPPAEHDEPLGARIARRIEQGLTGDEPIADMFAEVEGLLGEPIEDDPDDGRRVGLDEGDLGPLVREFGWECELDESDKARLDAFVAMQCVAPVPITTLEAVDHDDVLRFLLLAWLDRPNQTGAEEVLARFRLLEQFLVWSKETQDVDRAVALRVAHTDFVEPLPRLTSATAALVPAKRSPSPQPDGNPGPSASSRAPDLFTVVDVDADRATLRAVDPTDGAERQVRRTGSTTEWQNLQTEDLVLGRLDPRADRFDGIAIVLPSRVQRLLG